MPFYSTETIENVQLSTGNPGEYKPLAGEFMKAGVVTYRKGTGSKPHWRNNEEQYVYIIEGKRYMRLGDEETNHRPRRHHSHSPGNAPRRQDAQRKSGDVRGEITRRRPRPGRGPPLPRRFTGDHRPPGRQGRGTLRLRLTCRGRIYASLLFRLQNTGRIYAAPTGQP